MGLGVPAFASHYRDSSDTSSYWGVITQGGSTMQWHSSGGKVCTTCVRELKTSQRSSTTVGPGLGQSATGIWTYTTSAEAGEIQAWMTCSGVMTTWDAYYYVAGGSNTINQNAYCNSWVSVMTGVWVDRNVYLDNISYNGSEGRKVGWDGIRVYW